MIFFALQSLQYLTAVSCKHTHTHTHIHMLLSVSVRDLGYLTEEQRWASYRRGIAVAADTDRWLTVTQTRRRQLKRKRGWERKKKTRWTDGSYRVLPRFSAEQQLTHANALAQMLFYGPVTLRVTCFVVPLLFWSVWIAFFYGDCFKIWVSR